MKQLVQALQENKEAVEQLVSEQPDWRLAAERFDRLFDRMKDPSDTVWSAATFGTFKEVYFAQRNADKGMSNIVTRTLAGLPEKLHEDVRLIFLQIAEACCFFNGSHKVNFDASELPKDTNGIAIVPGKAKGTFTYGQPTPALYKKISLTFDYWVPKLIEWTEEVRIKGLTDWKGAAIPEHDSCTDFMRISLQFLADPEHAVPVAKAEDREALLRLFGDNFVWIKKSAKREDIVQNSLQLQKGLEAAAKEAGVAVPVEAWSRLQQAPFIKSVLK
jgi:hypothetical protein